MPVDQECTTGELPERYAFYDKNQDARNNGWVWYHRELPLDKIVRFYRDHFLTYFRDGVGGSGFVRFEDSLVLYQVFPADKDNKGRDHWVLLLAWLPANVEIYEVWKVLNNGVFRHVESDKKTLPEQLSIFDYDHDFVKLMYDGAKLDVPSDKGRLYIEKIRHRGAVDITFYWEKPNGEATIETQKQTDS